MTEPATDALSAGSLSARLDGAGLRDVAVAGHPALDAVYVTVRDAGWGTVAGTIVSRKVETGPAGGTAELEVLHQQGDVRFRWRGRLELTLDQLRLTVDGVAESEFHANRIGLCLLHPQRLTGRELRVGGPGGERTGRFAPEISPHQPHRDLDRMSYAVSDTDGLDIALAGEVFEMEDHRNWSDPGWKTYGPPLSRPFPVHYRPGQRVRQSIVLSARPGSGPRPGRRAGAPVQLVVGEEIGLLPVIGLGVSGLPDVDDALARCVQRLAPGYLHVELEHRPGWERLLQRAAAEAALVGVPLDVALVAAPQRVPELAAQVARVVPRLGRLSVFTPDRHTTAAGTVACARTAAARSSGPQPGVGGGSRANLAELNRGDFDLGTWDFVTYGLTPTVHHDDDRSVLGTVAAVADGLRRAASIAGDRPVVVGPLTLRPRFNAYTGGPDPMPDPAAGGPDADPRQGGPLAAVYLAGALIELVGAAAVTVFRTVGEYGVLDRYGAPRPAAAVLAVFAELAGAPARRVSGHDPDLVALLARPVAGAGGSTLVVVNLADAPRPVALSGPRPVATTVLTGGELDPARPVLPALSVTAFRLPAPDPE